MSRNSLGTIRPSSTPWGRISSFSMHHDALSSSLIESKSGRTSLARNPSAPPHVNDEDDATGGGTNPRMCSAWEGPYARSKSDLGINDGDMFLPFRGSFGCRFRKGTRIDERLLPQPRESFSVGAAMTGLVVTTKVGRQAGQVRLFRAAGRASFLFSSMVGSGEMNIY